MKINQFQNVRKMTTPEEHDQKLKEVSHLYEKQFLREMVKAMRGTVGEGEFMKPNQAEKIFREQLDQEYVEKWGDKGGIGLADMIYKQLLDRMGPALGIRQKPDRPMGPIALGEKSFAAKMLNDPNKPAQLKMQYDIQPPEKTTDSAKPVPVSVTAPWSGSVIGAQQINPDEYLLQMNHDNGLKSQMVFKGSLDKELIPTEFTGKSQEIQAGQRLGLLSPEAKNLFWTVDVVE
jgi:flagellar protein FlgJ